MHVKIVLHRDGETSTVGFDYAPRHEDEKPMALDVLLQAQARELPDLAFRYGCRARNCGVCTIDINGLPRIACRARVREGDTLSPMATLPPLADLVVRRDGVARQMRGRLSLAGQGNDLNVEAPEAYHALTACIECYACLHNCPMHARNFGGRLPNKAEPDAPAAATPADTNGRDPDGAYRWGNPFSLLKLQRLRVDPVTTETGREEALGQAIDLGLEACVGCPGCKCGVGIDLKGLVVAELLEAAGDRLPGNDPAE